MTRRQQLIMTLVLVSGVGATLANLLEVPSLIRVSVALWFLFVCPGLAIVQMLHIEDLWALLSVSIALSLAIDMLTAEVMLYAGAWSPIGGLFALVAFCAICLTAQALAAYAGRRRRMAQA